MWLLNNIDLLQINNNAYKQISFAKNKSACNKTIFVHNVAPMPNEGLPVWKRPYYVHCRGVWETILGCAGSSQAIFSVSNQGVTKIP